LAEKSILLYERLCAFTRTSRNYERDRLLIKVLLDFSYFIPITYTWQQIHLKEQPEKNCDHCDQSQDSCIAPSIAKDTAVGAVVDVRVVVDVRAVAGIDVSIAIRSNDENIASLLCSGSLCMNLFTLTLSSIKYVHVLIIYALVYSFGCLYLFAVFFYIIFKTSMLN
jgi:hypothetical protein